MLLYTHPVNDARSARGVLPVNSFWLSGTGALPQPQPPAAERHPIVASALRDAALNEDSTVVDLSFKDAGQGILQRLEVLLDTQTVQPELVLEPTAAAPEAKPEEATPTPTLQGLADLLVGRYPGRILLVRQAPHVTPRQAP